MKHTFTLLLFVFAITAFGQTEKGNSFISGNISTRYFAGVYPKDWPRKSNEFAFSTGVSYGKFVKDNIVWRNSLYGGFSRIFEQSNVVGSQATETIYPNTLISISSVGLYYFGKERWRGFIGGGIDANGTFNKIRNTGPGSSWPYDYLQKNAGFAVRPVFEMGALYFLNKHLALQMATVANSFPINTAGFSAGLVYWVKPTSFEIESKELTALQKGRWLLGAGFAINTSRFENTNPNYSSTTSSDDNDGKVNLQIGKFIKDRTRVGVYLGYSNRKYSQSYNNGQKTENYSANYNIGLYLKKYLAPTRLTPYFGLQLNYNRSQYRQVTNNTSYSPSQGNIYGLESSLGLAYVISNHFLVEAQLVEFTLTHMPETKRWGGVLSGGIQPNFSLSYVF